MKLLAPDISAAHYRTFRSLFGAYLVVHFASLVPYGAELFSSTGMIADASASPLAYAFPNVLAFWDGPVFVTSLLVFAVGLGGMFALGIGDRAAAVGLWYISACLIGRNPLIANPALPYVGLLLLAHACIPKLPSAPAGDSSAGTKREWRMPAGIYTAVWIAMAVGYTYSGLAKLSSPSWIDGGALAMVLENPLARDSVLRELVLSLPDGSLRVASWGALLLEVAFLPLSLSRRLRPFLWLAMLGMHFGLIVLIDFADLSLGMVFLHAFTFDRAWLPALGETGWGPLGRLRAGAIHPQ